MDNSSFQAGMDALARGAWEEARLCFETVLSSEETPEVWEKLGQAASCMDDAGIALRARERAYELYAASGTKQDAARMAVWLALDYAEFRGETAVANGWIQRAERLLEGEPGSYERGLLFGSQGYQALMVDKDPTEAIRLAVAASKMGREAGSAEIEMFGLGLEGLARVSQGEIGPGMGLLDESTAAVTGGEATNLTLIGTTCCFMIAACERVRDFHRALQWCGRLEEFCTRWRLRSFFAVCRTQYAMLLLHNGRWEEAEEELQRADQELSETRPALAPASTIRLGELRRRQGRWEAAEQLFATSPSHVLSLLGRAALCLDRGDARIATDLARRYLRRFHDDDRAERFAGLELLLRAEVQLENTETARELLAELQTIADTIGTQPLQAAVFHAQGLLSAAADNLATALEQFEDAADAYARVPMPYEAGRSLTALARVLERMERPKRAREEARSAMATFEALGAAAEVDRVRLLIGELGSPERKPAEDQAGLSEREREVIALLVNGMSNDQIADKLYLSVRTVERHISNIYLKIGVSGRSARAAAAAYAVEHGISSYT